MTGQDKPRLFRFFPSGKTQGRGYPIRPCRRRNNDAARRLRRRRDTFEFRFRFTRENRRDAVFCQRRRKALQIPTPFGVGFS